MDEKQLREILEKLLLLPVETETVEFKKATNGFDKKEIGQYFSALCNEANLHKEKCAWLVFGVDDKSHEILGTNFLSTVASRNDLKKYIADLTSERLTFVEIYELNYNGNRVVMCQIPPAPIGIPVNFKGYYHGRDGESLVALNIEEIETIRKENRFEDWSAEIVANATLDDLDPIAISKAREMYLNAHASLSDEIVTWDDSTFLNKAKITRQNKITNTAILLLGKEESESLISPSVAKIKWILKDQNNVERDYQIFSCPFILAIDDVYKKIRNLKYRYINPEYQTLFPEEIDTYEPYVIREALNNAIAHQDYTLCGQINVVESDDQLVFSNKGSFIPGTIKNVLESNSPEEYYRNTFLVTAMVGLKMVDTIGSGIRKMYNYQRKRLFPLPDYDISSNRVSVTIKGKILDMNYSNILAKATNLSLMEIEMLNRVQLGKPLLDDEIKILRKHHLIEGRKPNIYIAKDVAQKTGQKVAYSIHKGLDDKGCEELLMQSLIDHKSLRREEIDELLLKVLPDVLSEQQKINKIKNLLTKLRKRGKIKNSTKGNKSEWYLVKRD